MSPTTIARRQRRAEHSAAAGPESVGGVGGVSHDGPEAARTIRLSAWALAMTNSSPATALSLATLLARTGI